MSTNKRTVGDLTKDLDGMIAQLGLNKLASVKTSADGGGIGESAGVIGDAGTSQPAKQEADRSNIQPATEGAQSAANTQILKDEVPANVASANPSDASNSGAASSTENTTTATMVGKDPKVEDGYGSRQETLNAPSTTHPADVNKDPEKYSAQILASASFIDKEFEKLASVQQTPAAGAAPADAGKITVGDRISEILLGKEASAQDKDAAIHQGVQSYLAAFAKTASLIGEMTADTLELLYKQAEGEELPPEAAPAEAAPAEGGDMIPAEALAAGDQSGAMDSDAEALAAAAVQIAEQLGVSPEDVLEAAAQELVAGQAGGGAPAEAAPAPGAPEGLPAEAAGAIEGEKMASVKADELSDLRAKAEELAQYKAAMAQAAEEDRMARIVSAAVANGLNSAATAK